jgi:hypothetical protein
MSWLFGKDVKDAFDKSVEATGRDNDNTEHVRWDEMTDEERAAYSELADGLDALFILDWTVELG